MQAIALLLVAAAVGANPWSVPEAGDAVHPPATRAERDDAATLAEHRARLKQSARPQPAPVAPATVNPYRNRGDVRPAGYEQQPNAGGNARLAQYVDNEVWPTTGDARNAENRAATVGRNGRQASPGLADNATVRGADPYNPKSAPAFALPTFGDDDAANPSEARFPAARQQSNFSPDPRPDQVFQSALPNGSSSDVPGFDPPGAIEPQSVRGPVRGVRQAQLDRQTRRGADALQGNFRGGATDPPTLSDPFTPTQSPATPRERGVAAQVPTSSVREPIIVNKEAPTGNAGNNQSLVRSPAVPKIDVGLTPTQSKILNKPAEVVGDAAEQLRETTQGGGALLLLAFFASVGLNFYLGWIAWDTYNRYQDMVSDLRHSGTSSRRDRNERDHVERRSDRRLAESAAY